MGLPLGIFSANYFFKKIGENQWRGAILILLPFWWTVWDYIASRFSFLPVFIIQAGNALGSSPFLGLAKFGGIITLTFFVTLVNVLIAALVLKIDFKRAKWREVVDSLAGIKVLGLIFILAFILLAGFFMSKYELRENYDHYRNLGRSLKVAVISSNASFDNSIVSFRPSTSLGALQGMFASIRESLADGKFDLIAFPENMINEEFIGADAEAQRKFGIDNQGDLIKAYREVAESLDSQVFATFTTLEKGTRYKSNFLFGKDGKIMDISHKSRLTFLSEYWPFGSWRPFYYDWILKIDPEVVRGSPVFDPNYEYTAGQSKIFSLNNAAFSPLICVEAHYPDDLDKLRTTGSQFFIHTSNNEWVRIGLIQYFYLSDNLRKIEAVWLDTPIIINGRYERAGIIMPDGKTDTADYQSSGKNYGIWQGEVRY